MYRATSKTRAHVTAAIAAMWLAACGGGGGGDSPANPPVAVNPPAPAPAPAGPLAWSAAATLPTTSWHWVASNPSGTVLAAAVIPGKVYVSRDSGANWVDSGLPDANWISLDMSANGERMVAVGFFGSMYRSTDSGATWSRIDTAFNPTNSREYESVTLSHDGQRVVAAVLNGPIYVSQNGGNSFVTAGGSAAAANAWRSVDSSADGSVVVAVTQGNGVPGQVHVSTDAGVTFAARPVTTGGVANPGGWYRVAMSDNGDTIAVAGNSDYAGTSTGLYVSRNRGTTWTQGISTPGTYSSVDTSANGDIIATTRSGTNGQVLLSTNGGQSFAPITAPAGQTNWRALAMNAAATRVILAAGTFPTDASPARTGQVYLSSGSLTGQ